MRAPLSHGRGVATQSGPAGLSISAPAEPRWRHPWFVSPAWSAEAARWVATIKPGFVNGRCPVWRATMQPLTSAPALPLLWRALGFDGAPGSGVPKFFADLGAKASTLGGLAEAGEFLDFDTSRLTEPPPAGLRLLRACDLWLHQPRAALTSTVSLVPDLLTGTSLATQTLSETGAAPEDVLQVMTGAWQPLGTLTPDPLSGEYTEPAWDEVAIATVYALSPADTEPGSDPDATWTLYVQHALFWNPHYQARTLQPPADTSTGLFLPLAGGAAQLVISSLVGSLNDATQNALNVLRAHSLAGTFWTPTGGGHDAHFPPAPVAIASGRTGLDKDGRLTAQAQTAANAPLRARLDPAFPYVAAPFAPALLSPAA